jgi:adenine-specific DNA glycosylase
LCSELPQERWTRTSDTLILHGRRICRPKPLCDQCAVQENCDYFDALQRLRRPIGGHKGSHDTTSATPKKKRAKAKARRSGRRR